MRSWSRASATTETQQAILKQREAATAAFKGLAGTKDKTLLSMASQSAAFLDSYVVPPAQRDAIFAAVEAKDPNALAAAMKSAELMSVNAEAMRNARVAEARIAAGKLEGTPEQMYQTASTISEQEDRRVMAKRGEAIREALRRPATAMDARRMIADTARIVAGSVHGTADLLAQSGVFQANQEQMAGFANQAIERMLAPLAATSGVPIEELRDEVYAQLNQRPAQAVERRPTASDNYRTNQGGLMTGAGISGA